MTLNLNLEWLTGTCHLTEEDIRDQSSDRRENFLKTQPQHKNSTTLTPCGSFLEVYNYEHDILVKIDLYFHVVVKLNSIKAPMFPLSLSTELFFLINLRSTSVNQHHREIASSPFNTKTFLYLIFFFTSKQYL